MSDRMTSLEIAFATLGATVTTKLDALIVAVSAQHSDHEARVRALEVKPAPDATHEGRIAKLERAWWMLAGAALALGGGAGALVNALFG